MPLKYRNYQSPKEEEVFNPESGKVSEDPFHVDIGHEEEEVQEVKTDYSSMTVKELKLILKTRGLSQEGKKADLVARLEPSEAGPAEALSVEDEEAPLEEAASENEVGELNEETEKADSLTGNTEDNDRTG